FAPPALAVLLCLAGLSLALSLFLRWPGGSPAGALGSTLSGTFYVGIPMAFLPLLRGVGDRVPGVAEMGPWVPMAFVLFPLLVTWAGDTAAYLVGNAVGRRKLAPTVSPGKSVEGALGGVLGSVGAAVLVAHLWLTGLASGGVSLATAAWMGAVLAVGTQVGDLVESVLKREAGVKDSGRLLPGHGGFLDRLDALLWAFPLTWAMLAAVGGLP
ncbi:MAG TPA: phosphatidate cytidylyltransferase, partial [Longimicrobiales bacterium]|nr:phosphatidate cytidylyltransferase [Longimicrobiales bacterium]